MNSRDTHGFAVKATWAQINGKSVDLFKQPKTDPTKNSAKGRFSVVWDSVEFKYKLVPEVKRGDAMFTYFNNGKIEYNDTFEEIRGRAISFSRTLEVVLPK